MPISVFDSSVVAGDGDSNVSNPTPGLIFAHQRNAVDNEPDFTKIVDASLSSEYQATQRLPPSITNNTVNNSYITYLIVAYISAHNRRINLELASGATYPSARDNTAGPNLTETAEDNLGIAFRAADGTTVKWRISDLDDVDEDDPYSWTTNDITPAFETSLRASGAQVVLVDITNSNVDWDNLQFTSVSGDIPHSDTHLDTPHSDIPHIDGNHIDEAHNDEHIDGVHIDEAHVDESHVDVTHIDTHVDGPHQDIPHDDTNHSDASPQDDHSDVIHIDVVHDDSPYIDTAHVNTHDDRAHSDSAPHLDIAHVDTDHQDQSHFDSHTDKTHADLHEDSHIDAAQSGERIIGHWLLEFVGLGYAIWSGSGILTYNNKTYYGASQFMELSVLDYQVDQPSRRLTATLAAGSDEIQRIFVTDDNVYLVEIIWIVSLDGGVTYSNSGRRYLGRTNGPTYSNGQYTVEIEPTLSDQFRQEPRYWSDEEQQTKYPGDLGFSYASELVDGLKKGRWPR